tara:strand:+ start:662 stop:1285 length:624 start_codon:yes stop_codon:yes gene_type:complete
MSDVLKRILSSIVLVPLTLFFIFAGSYYFIFFTIICFLIAFYEWNKMNKKFNFKVIGFIFLLFSFYTFYENFSNTDLGLFVLLVCISTDIGGYLFGKIFKGPKLTKISPNKTYSGMIGGYFLSLIFLSYFFNWDNNQVTIYWFITTILLSTISQIGDIIISYFKRLSKIKNTGKIIPGHGGLLDRIDGMIFAFPLFYFIEMTGYLIS